MNKYIGTFGSAHLASCGINCHVEIEAPDMNHARAIMNKATEGKWSGCYDESFGYDKKYNTIKIGRLVFTDVGAFGEIYWETHKS